MKIAFIKFTQATNQFTQISSQEKIVLDQVHIREKSTAPKRKTSSIKLLISPHPSKILKNNQPISW